MRGLGTICLSSVRDMCLISWVVSKSNLPSLFEWLQTWDGAEGKMGQTVHKKSSSMSWLTKKAFFKITVITGRHF